MPSPVAEPDLVDAIGREVIAPTLVGVRAEGSTYKGVLYAGIMLTADGFKVLEFNCRFGDPETQAVLPLLRSDLAAVMTACAGDGLADVAIEWSDDASVTVVMASKGYPGSSVDPAVVHGLGAAEASGLTVFHAGTDLVDGEVMATGGRVLAVTAVAPELGRAADLAHERVSRIDFAGSQHRIDIARAASGAGS